MANTMTVRRRGPRRGVAVAGTLACAGLLATVHALAGPAAPAGASHSPVRTVHVSTAEVAHVGTVLTTGKGLTLYYFEKDPVGKATCTGACAKIWPPYLAAKGARVKGPKGVKGLSVIKVGGGHWQVAFDHAPLYRFDGDKKKGQAKGQDFADVWYAALKSGIPAKRASAAAPTNPATQLVTPTTQAPPATTTPAGPAPTTPDTAPPMTTPAGPAPTTPATTPPMTTPPTVPPPPPTTTTLPPTTTTTATPSGGGVSF